MNSGCLQAGRIDQEQLSGKKVELESESDTDVTATEAISGSEGPCVQFGSHIFPFIV